MVRMDINFVFRFDMINNLINEIQHSNDTLVLKATI